MSLKFSFLPEKTMSPAEKSLEPSLAEPSKKPFSFVPSKTEPEKKPEDQKTEELRPFNETLKETLTQTLKNLPIIAGFSPEQITKGVKTQVELFERGTGAMRSVLGAEGDTVFESLKEGWKDPEAAPLPSESVLKAHPDMDYRLAGTLGTMADAGIMYLLGGAIGRGLKGLETLGSPGEQMNYVMRTMRARPEYKTLINQYAKTIKSKTGQTVPPEALDNIVMNRAYDLSLKKGPEQIWKQFKTTLGRNIKSRITEPRIPDIRGKKGFARIGEEAEPLRQEARKFKTAEEFVKSVKHPALMSEKEFTQEEVKGMGVSWKNAVKLPDGTIVESSTRDHGDMIAALEESRDIDAKEMERGWTWKGFPKEESYISVPDVSKSKGSFYEAYKLKHGARVKTSLAEIWEQAQQEPAVKPPKGVPREAKTYRQLALDLGGFQSKLVKEWDKGPLKGVFRKEGGALDQIAEEMISMNMLNVPSDMTNADYLYKMLEEDRPLPAEQEAAMEKNLEQEYQAYMKSLPQEEVEEAFEFDPKRYEAEIAAMDKIGTTSVSGYNHLGVNNPIFNLRKKRASLQGKILAGKINRHEANIKRKRMNEEILRSAEEQNIAIITKPNGQRIPAIRKTGVYAEKEFETHKFKDKHIGKADNFMSFSATVDNIQEGKGMGPMTRLAYSIYESIGQRNQFVFEIMNEIGSVIPASMRSAWGGGKGKDGQIIYAIMEGVPIPHGATLEHHKVAGELRNKLDKLRLKANEVRKPLGKKAIGYVKDYAPHVQTSSLWQRLIGDTRTVITDAFDFIIPNEIQNPHVKERIGEMEDRERDIFKLVPGYVNAIANDVYVTAAIEKLKAAASVLKSREYYNSGNFIDRYIREGLVKKPTTADVFFGLRTGSMSRKLTTKIVSSRALAALNLNIPWILYTQTASHMMLTPMKTGFKNALVGSIKWMISPSRRKEINDYTAMKLKLGQGIGKTVAGEMDRNVTKVFQSPIVTFRDFLSTLQSANEHHLTGMAISAGLERGKKYGLEGKELEMYADYIGQVTQSMYNAESRPLLLNSILVRAFFPFQTFIFEAFRHIKVIAGKGGGFPLNKRQRLGHLIRLLAGAMLVNYLHEQAKGKKLTTVGSFIPLVGKFVDEQIEKVTGSVQERAGQKPRWTGQGRSPIAPLEDVKNIRKAITDAIGKGDFNALRQQLIFWASGLSGIGGGVQANRVIDGLMAVEKGYVEVGKKKVKIKDSPENIFRVMIGGPYSLPKVREEFKKQATGKKKYSFISPKKKRQSFSFL